MPRKSNASYNLTEEGSSRSNKKATRITRDAASDDLAEDTALGSVASPDGDEVAENRVNTSLNDE
jgi:hypothetical protein